MINRGRKSGAFVTGLIVGGLSGAATALLLAPRSGEDSRREIRGRSQAIQNKLSDAGDGLRLRAEETAQSTLERALEIQERSQMLLDEQRLRLEKAIEAGRKAGQEKMAELSGEKNGKPARASDVIN